MHIELSVVERMAKTQPIRDVINVGDIDQQGLTDVCRMIL